MARKRKKYLMAGNEILLAHCDELRTEKQIRLKKIRLKYTLNPLEIITERTLKTNNQL